MVIIVCRGDGALQFPGPLHDLLTNFPTDPDIRLTGITWVEDFIAWAVSATVRRFLISFTYRHPAALLDALEVMLVSTRPGS